MKATMKPTSIKVIVTLSKKEAKILQDFLMDEISWEDIENKDARELIPALYDVLVDAVY